MVWMSSAACVRNASCTCRVMQAAPAERQLLPRQMSNDGSCVREGQKERSKCFVSQWTSGQALDTCVSSLPLTPPASHTAQQNMQCTNTNTEAAGSRGQMSLACLPIPSG